MDQKTIAALSIMAIGLLFIVFRKFFARGAVTYIRNNIKKIKTPETTKEFEIAYFVMGSVAIIYGLYYLVSA